MKQSLIIKFFSVVCLLLIAQIVIFGSISIASATPPSPSGAATQACNGLKQFNGTNASCTPSSRSSIMSVVQYLIEVLSYVIGVVSVIVIIYAGFRYVTSGGDSNSVNSAKNTLLYAAVGLAIAVIVQVIARIVVWNR